MKHTSTPARTPPARRRGMAVAVIVVVIAVLGLAVAGSVAPARQESDAASLRVQTVRAFFAAESGVSVLIGTVAAAQDEPQTGDSIAWGTQSVEFETVAGDSVVVIGRSGQAQRRISIEFE